MPDGPFPWDKAPGASDGERMLNWLASIAEEPAIARYGAEEGRIRIARVRRLIERLFTGTLPARVVGETTDADLRFMLTMARVDAHRWGAVSIQAIDEAQRALTALKLMRPPAPWDPPIAFPARQDVSFPPTAGTEAPSSPVVGRLDAIIARFARHAPPAREPSALAGLGDGARIEPATAPPAATQPPKSASVSISQPTTDPPPWTETTKRKAGEMPPADAEYLTVAQAAQLANVADATIRAWTKRGALPRHGRGRVFRIRRVELEAFLKGPPEDRPPDPDEQAAKILARRRGRSRS
jgi:excisionase family DNA binding protein